MSLVSISFFLFVIGTVITYYIIPKKYQWIVLLIASYCFYIISVRELVLYLLASTLSIYVGARLIQKRNDESKAISKDLDKDTRKAMKLTLKRKKQRIVFFALLVNIGLLLVLKYSNFMIGNLNGIFNLLSLDVKLPNFVFLMPLGISYYTLMAISYVIDVYRGKYEASKQLGQVALYLSFFPHISEGPISRFNEISEPLMAGKKYDFNNIKIGFYLILFGLFKKLVIADRAGLYVDEVFKGGGKGLVSLMGIALYTLQIYAEFSAAMDIVRGVSYMFGIYLPQNFKRPFISKSIQEFWRRWHITLGTWLKDYVFYSVSLSKMNLRLNGFVKQKIKGNIGKFILTAFPLFFVWFLNGFWHGATWKFVMYGLYYYIVMMLGLLLEPLFIKLKEALKINDKTFIYSVFAILRTVLIVMFGMLIFRSHSLVDAFRMFYSLFANSDKSILDFGLTIVDFTVLFGGFILMCVLGWLKEAKYDLYELVDKKSRLLSYICIGFIICCIVIFGIYGEGYNVTNFIYGEF